MQFKARKLQRAPAPPTSTSLWALNAAGGVRAVGRCSSQHDSAPASWAFAGELGRAVGAEAVSPGATRGCGRPWGAGAGSGVPFAGLGQANRWIPDVSRAAGAERFEGRRAPIESGTPPPLLETRPGLSGSPPGWECSSGRQDLDAQQRSGTTPRTPESFFKPVFRLFRDMSLLPLTKCPLFSHCWTRRPGEGGFTTGRFWGKSVPQ